MLLYSTIQLGHAHTWLNPYLVEISCTFWGRNHNFSTYVVKNVYIQIQPQFMTIDYFWAMRHSL